MKPRVLSARDDRRKLAMTAGAKLDEGAFRLPHHPPVGARARRTNGAAAMQASTRNLSALGDGKAQSARDVKPDDLVITIAFHTNPCAAGAVYESQTPAGLRHLALKSWEFCPCPAVSAENVRSGSHRLGDDG